MIRAKPAGILEEYGMEITRNVILDLLPLYLAGEASPETRALIEEYLRRDPELAERVRLQSSETFLRTPASLRPEVELRSFRRTKRLLGLLRWLFGLGLTFTLLPLSFEMTADKGRITEFHFLLRDYPAPFLGSLVLGITCWVAYFTIRRRLHTRVD
jgi:predicted anti-sigma-YlaC factor YlaD